MNGKSHSITPEKVKKVSTPYRRIVTPIPVPESMPILEDLRKHEPRSMRGQPPIIWDRAEGFQVYDKYGNMWLDWSSGVLVTSAGHGRKEIKKAIVDMVNHGLLHNYCFPSEIRAKLVKKLAELAPDPLSKVFLLTTGSEAVECAIKLARTWGQKIGGKKKIGIISFEGAFHGRTLGAQMIGGIPSLKEWIVNLDSDMYQLPFPGDFRCEDRSFDTFIQFLKKNHISPDQIAAVISETYQGGGVFFMPKKYAKELAKWCKENKILLIFDEIQAGFGRTGKMFGFEHYEVVPDIICCGKGITSSLPLSAVIGRAEILDLYPPGTMTSTHTGNPVCVAAALANLEIIEKERLYLRAAEVGNFLSSKLKEIQGQFPKVIGAICGKGLVYGIHVIKDSSKDPDGELALKIVKKCVEKGLMLFSPVGTGGATIKICPPLIITKEAIEDGIVAFAEAIE
ncbi:aspartate aminotransferase family protein, partial [Candidatus Aerophobetes bacterium]|nr:aspartate aminotransferase family protein [Candidatus Aerophobetes bacterium]